MFIRKKLLEKLLEDDREQRRLIQTLLDKVDNLEHNVLFHGDELRVDDDKPGYRREPITPITVKTMIFDILDFMNLTPVYDKGRKPGYNLESKPSGEKNGSHD